MKKTYLSIALIALLLPLQVGFASKHSTFISAIPEQPIRIITTVVKNIQALCEVPVVENSVYDGQLMSVDVPSQVDANQVFIIKISYKNTGNRPWFSQDSGCPGQSWTFLGTTRQTDRQSPFFTGSTYGETGWYQSNRIKMMQKRVDPGEIADFEFIATAPLEEGIYREYFAPVIEKQTWLDSKEANFDIKVGQPAEDENILGFTRELESSINLLDKLFQGEKKIVVKLSSQTMQIKVGDLVLKNYPVSTGKPSTPTPTGNYKIFLKQDVRVGGEAPHYIMPKYMMFRKGGYGIHALPSLANDKGVFWREALNHIGSPRSHGCIRLLPDDAEFAYKFAELGTSMDVVW